ncbi:hypothetical protein EON64_15000, partial [archaeon]
MLDCSDVVLQVVDARNVPGTRCYHIERHMKAHASHKQLITILNKCDLVPAWCARKWIALLSKEGPCLGFRAAHNNKAFGKGALITLLRQFGKLHNVRTQHSVLVIACLRSPLTYFFKYAQNKRQISVGVIGYPNTGKSSLINTLTGNKSCVTAPVPGQTKVWQYVKLTQKIHLIDSPGIVYEGEEESEVDTVLKGVVRAERLKSPPDFIPPILQRVQAKYLNKQYAVNFKGFEPSGDHAQDMVQALEFLSLVAIRSGRLLAGGEPDVDSVSKMVINDFQRGKLPYFVPPPSDAGGSEDAEEEEEEGEEVEGEEEGGSEE